jgi:hypothetical protein
MKATSRTTHAKSSGKTKKPASQSADRAALAHARTLLSERPTMKANTALKKAGVSSPRKIERLSAVLSARPAMPLRSNDSINIRAAKGPAATSSPASQRAEPLQKDASHAVDQDQFSKRLEALMKTSTGGLRPAETETGSKDGITNRSTNGARLNSWSRMFQWSPYGLVLWQAAFLTDFVSKMTKSSLKCYGQGRA